ncbi:phage terminase small subunit P27 family [Caenibacillus caldisaponilyticus]|uniref:phage terminase small subunit P27 family n=1 Tax=Caenibacillus caldisaponilyticus TaxID=1674942 RepID=UPI0009888F73|nr:phage terminase small subunit P27 family [Caenibacillus caldisaponilyticus]
MGRKAIPIELQLINGNKNRLTKSEIEQRREAEKKIKPKSNKVKPPAWLNDVAKKEFKRIVKEMQELEILTNVDVDALALYCDAYASYIECTRIIDEEGMMVEYTNKAAETNKVPHPLLTKKKQLAEQMKALATEMGLTPASRAKLAMPKEQPKEPTEFERLFGDV